MRLPNKKQGRKCRKREEGEMEGREERVLESGLRREEGEERWVRRDLAVIVL